MHRDTQPEAAAPDLHAELEGYLQLRIPGSRLEKTLLPQVSEIALYLINADYPRDGLTREQAEALMDNPPYWAFCWASGQVLSRWLLDNPQQVKGKLVVDFGAGSGVVGIAAHLAGAAQVILCDMDQLALQAAQLNTATNAAEVQYATDLDTLLASPLIQKHAADSVVTVADVFYDRENLPLLALLQKHFATVLVADSRLKGQPLQGMSRISQRESHTVPDLDESREFNCVTLYCSQR